jgi:uncharacterized protein (DUF2236 family)
MGDAAATTVVQRIGRERMVLFGWSRAILMQFSHPLIAAGVAQHSSFRGGAIQAAVRLHHTVSSMLTLMFGDAVEHAAAIAHIRAIHKTVNGTLTVDAGPWARGTPYSAEDPALLLWVHATLIDSTADIYQRIVAPLGEAERDVLCVQSAPVLHELGGDPERTPLTWSALQAYIARIYESGVLVVTDQARQLGRAVLSPKAGGLPVPLSGLGELVTLGLLPPPLRDAYGFRWDASRQRQFERAIAVLGAIRRTTPAALAHWRAARRQVT